MSEFLLTRVVFFVENNDLFVLDTAWKTSSIPGVPGQDYPVHQHHVHNNLRYHASRFLCPTDPGTHVYLPDRASRCQVNDKICEK